VFYGDRNNWWATYALWVFSLFGHPDVRILDGGRAKWQAEGREMTTEQPKPDAVEYPVVERDDTTIRAFKDDVLAHLGGALVDVRSPGEYSGELLHMPDYPQEGAVRGGHIPGAASVPWARAAAEDATFKSRADLEAIYQEEQGLAPGDDVVAYCRIGERSSHTWFVLTHLLGFERVRNYDGSWTEWGNAVRVPIAQGSERGSG
jgi:thiosulfate/3-mercaptopyruvate sulfurtransferase